MGACGAVPQVSDLTQVLRQVVLVVGLGSQLQVATEWVQPHRIGPAGANRVIRIIYYMQMKYDGQTFF